MTRTIWRAPKCRSPRTAPWASGLDGLVGRSNQPAVELLSHPALTADQSTKQPSSTQQDQRIRFRHGYSGDRVEAYDRPLCGTCAKRCEGTSRAGAGGEIEVLRSD